MTTFKLFSPRSSSDKTSCKHFKQLKQFYFQNQIGTIMIVLLTIFSSCNTPTTPIVAATTIASKTNKEQAINHFLDYKASFIATGVPNSENIKEDKRSNSTAKVSLLDSLSFSSRLVE